MTVIFRIKNLNSSKHIATEERPDLLLWMANHIYTLEPDMIAHMLEKFKGRMPEYDEKLLYALTQKKWEGNLYFGGKPLRSLGNLQSIGGYLDLEGTPITSLGKLKSVGGNLDLEGTPITSLGNLQSVGGDLFLKNTPNLSWENIPKHLWDKVEGKEGRSE
jgi:hypothetical protein